MEHSKPRSYINRTNPKWLSLHPDRSYESKYEVSLREDWKSLALKEINWGLGVSTHQITPSHRK